MLKEDGVRKERENLSANLKRIRSDKKISRELLSGLSNVGLSTIRNIEYGDYKKINLDIVIKLARVLEVTLEELIVEGASDNNKVYIKRENALEYRNNLAENVEAIRMDKEISRYMLAKSIGLKYQSIRKIELGEISVKQTTIYKLSRMLDISIDNLVYYKQKAKIRK